KKGARLVFATALSQQPYLKGEEVGGHHFYRPRDISLLLSQLHVSALRITPVMAHQFLVDFATADERDRAREKLDGIMFNGHRLFYVALADGNSLYLGNQVYK